MEGCQLIVSLPLGNSVPIFLISVPPIQPYFSSPGSEYYSILTSLSQFQALGGEIWVCPPSHIVLLDNTLDCILDNIPDCILDNTLDSVLDNILDNILDTVPKVLLDTKTDI